MNLKLLNGRMMKLVCSNCKGTNVHTLAWVDANTNEYRSEFSQESQDQWCEDCQEHFELEWEEHFNNGDLQREIQKIKTFDATITIATAYDDNLDYSYGIDVEDTSYWYANEDERDEDYVRLEDELTAENFKFVG